MKSLEDLKVIREKMQNGGDDDQIKIVVGMATCGIAAGAKPVMQKFVDEINNRGIKNVKVKQTGCVGVCRFEPLAEVYVPGKEKVTYVKLNADMVTKIIEDHIVNNKVVEEYTIGAAE